MTKKDIMYELEKRDNDLRSQIENVIELIEINSKDSAIEVLKEIMEALED